MTTPNAMRMLRDGLLVSQDKIDGAMESLAEAERCLNDATPDVAGARDMIYDAARLLRQVPLTNWDL